MFGVTEVTSESAFKIFIFSLLIFVGLLIAAFVTWNFVPPSFTASSNFFAETETYRSAFFIILVFLIFFPMAAMGFLTIKEQQNYTVASFLFILPLCFLYIIKIICIVPISYELAFLYTKHHGETFNALCKVSEKLQERARNEYFYYLRFSDECLGSVVIVNVGTFEFEINAVNDSYRLQGVRSKYGVYVTGYGRDNGNAEWQQSSLNNHGGK